jgi:hypothetical protein
MTSCGKSLVDSSTVRPMCPLKGCSGRGNTSCARAGSTKATVSAMVTVARNVRPRPIQIRFFEPVCRRRARYGFALGTMSGGDLWMQKESGVILHLKAKHTALMLSLGGDAVVISTSQ